MKTLGYLLIATAILIGLGVLGCSQASKEDKLSENARSMSMYFLGGTDNPWWNFYDDPTLKKTLRNPEYLEVLRSHLKGFKNDEELIERGVEALKLESISKWNQFAKEKTPK